MPVPVIHVRVSKVSPGAVPTPQGELEEMVRDAFKLIERAKQHPNPIHKKTWFGSSGEKPEVEDWTNKMFNYLGGGLNKLTFACCKTPGSIASCAMYQADRVRGGRDTPNTGVDIQLNDGFRSDLYSYGEKVGTILHELTHKCIGTNDEQIALKDCYGAILCEVMARVRPELALTNADNWGYYFTAYHADCQLTGDKWRYLTAAELEGVGPRIV